MIKREKIHKLSSFAILNFACPYTSLFFKDAACLSGADKAEADGDYGQHRSGAKAGTGRHLLAHLCLDLKQIDLLKKIFDFEERDRSKDSVPPVR
jgi:hypothetical protein